MVDMKLSIRMAVFLSLAAFCGAVLGFFVGLYVATDVTYRWQTMTGGSFGYTSEALSNSDIRLPEIKHVSGEAKFLEDFRDRPNTIRLGYKVLIDVDKLDWSKIPEKYKTPETIKTKDGEFIRQPVSEVAYKVTIHFSLKDKDGFAIMHLRSRPLSIFSGEENVIQDLVDESFPSRIGKRINSIAFGITAEKCETCE